MRRLILNLLAAVLLPVCLCAADDDSVLTASSPPQNAPPRKLDLPSTPYRYSQLDLPPVLLDRLGRLDNTPVDNPLTDHGATLGRVLFYDKSLSANGTTSCATCHVQENAFSDPRATSVGFRGERVTRNSMSLVNLRFYARDKFFWDERADGLESQVLMPIENPIEMGHTLDALLPQLSRDPIYRPLFTNAFGDPDVTAKRIAKALAQFVRSIVSFQSRYDIGLRQVGSPREDFPNFTEQENLGKRQFFGRARCAECHLPGHDDDGIRQWSIFQLSEPGNNGIDVDGPDVDAGVASYSGRTVDRGKFKASSLRNIELTGPYMHDGRFITLDQVIEHYNWSVRPHENLDPRLADFSANGLALPEVPKVALAAFLATLTDRKLLTDPKYSDPFVKRP
ncbi:Cytochrome c551 peroxidase precursor [Stieleria maiorica]|uniref:Cytochrome c551 peroxidase n=1 Tax=Stieleria maiorica TaxID=2795974 RepID=A0A5B9MIU6_9BACT|nr:cytochrome c peroxidase [Stieleria maiorica]QEG00844.1 Cytochrome c551 peroxidase precursor [Stieleria maiorica]